MTRRKKSGCNLYHVTARGVGKSIIFEDDADRMQFLGTLRSSLETCGVELVVWCLMDNHYHLLVRGELENVSKTIQCANSSYAQFFNGRHQRSGHLFQSRFGSEPVDTEEYLLTVIRYIHQNPVVARIAPGCDYAWSSYRGILEEPWEEENEFVVSLFGGVDQFVQFHQVIDRGAPCLDAGKTWRSRTTEELYEIACSALHGARVEEVASLGRAARDEAVRALKAVGLSARQIERLTGVAKSVVSRA